MTLCEITAAVMLQANQDFEDACDFEPVLLDYINEGYDLLHEAWTGKHVMKRLHEEEDRPCLPPWAHRAIVDWATWLIYRNGPAHKQQRGAQYKYSFGSVRARLIETRNGGKQNFFNIPR